MHFLCSLDIISVKNDSPLFFAEISTMTLLLRHFVHMTMQKGLLKGPSITDVTPFGKGIKEIATIEQRKESENAKILFTLKVRQKHDSGNT